MFNNANSFNQPLSRWDISNVKSMVRMFDQANSFNQSLSSWVKYNNDCIRGMYN